VPFFPPGDNHENFPSHPAGRLAVAALAARPGPAQDFKPRLVRFGYGLVGTSTRAAPALFAKEVEKASGGKMKVRAIGNGLAGLGHPDAAGPDRRRAGDDGRLHRHAGGHRPRMAIWDTPFLFNNTKEADVVLDGPVGQKVKDKLQPKGMVGLVYWENGFRNLTNNKRPITKLEDLDGIKLRVMQNNVFLDSFKTLGANAVPLPFSELFTALETKAVDGQENPFNTMLSSKFYEVQKYLTVSNHVYSPWIVTVSKWWWDTER
jgi:tripartite ATP-independent transporter DctP family solute receptor